MPEEDKTEAPTTLRNVLLTLAGSQTLKANVGGGLRMNIRELTWVTIKGLGLYQLYIAVDCLNAAILRANEHEVSRAYSVSATAYAWRAIVCGAIGLFLLLKTATIHRLIYSGWNRKDEDTSNKASDATSESAPDADSSAHQG
jgi:hypothetical protein